VKVQAGAWKRLGKRSATGTSERGDTPNVGWCGSGAGDGMVAMGASITGNGRGTTGMSLRATWLLGSPPKICSTKESWVGAGRRFSFSSSR